LPEIARLDANCHLGRVKSTASHILAVRQRPSSERLVADCLKSSCAEVREWLAFLLDGTSSALPLAKVFLECILLLDSPEDRDHRDPALMDTDVPLRSVNIFVQRR